MESSSMSGPHAVSFPHPYPPATICHAIIGDFVIISPETSLGVEIDAVEPVPSAGGQLARAAETVAQ